MKDLLDKLRVNVASPRFSVRNGIVFMLVALSALIVLVSGGVYRDLALDNHANSLSNLLSYESDEVFQHLEHDLVEVTLAAQIDPQFRTALHKRDRAAMETSLRSQFRQYVVTADIVRLEQMSAFDLKFDVLAHVAANVDAAPASSTHCPALIEQARRALGAERLMMRSGLCVVDGVPHYGLLVPVGGLRPAGYLLASVDPVPSLRNIENALNVVLRVDDAHGRERYRSPSWMTFRDEHHALAVSHTLHATDGAQAAVLNALIDIRGFRADLVATRNIVMFVAAVVTFLVVLLALWMLQRTTLQPLQRITEQLGLQRRDRSRLGQAIRIDGGKEVLALTHVFNDMNAELARLYQRYRQMAYTDPLTSLPNRAWFQRRLASTLTDASRNTGQRFAILMLDLDGFKEVNDTLGHHVGDALLRQVSERLRAVVGDDQHTLVDGGDAAIPGLSTERQLIVARLGGDEFAFLLSPLPSTPDIHAWAGRIAAGFDARFDIEGQAIVIGGSVGAAIYPDHGRDSETLLRRADVALYAAKGAQQPFALYDSSLDENSRSQLSLRSELSAGIKNGELVLFFQPKLDLRTGSVRGVEALVRWQHPERGLVPPDQFIPLAEKRGLIKPLTNWVLGEALRLQAQWRAQGLEITTAINLSSSMLYDLSMPNTLAEQLERSNVPASAIELEITENATMADPARALDIMNRLNEMGVRLAIDDFGTGYSSLAYLKRLPVDIIKIDKSFVTEMGASESDTKIVHATIDLAHNLGLRVVAEGVEDDSVLATLHSLQCDTVQGFGISRPLPADGLLAWLQTGWMRYREQFDRMNAAIAPV